MQIYNVYSDTYWDDEPVIISKGKRFDQRSVLTLFQKIVQKERNYERLPILCDQVYIYYYKRLLFIHVTI